MKEFRKTEKGFFICEECKQPCKKIINLSRHILYTHDMTTKEYFDKWLKEDNEGKGWRKKYRYTLQLINNI
jgi:predicted transcriptional regulator